MSASLTDGPSTSKVVHMTSATDRPITTQTIGDRVRCLAALRALIAYLDANPDLPAPTSVEAAFHVHGGTSGARLDVVTDAAATMGMETRVSPTTAYVELPIGDRDPSELGIRYVVRTHLEDRAGF
jgi:hypothetical protein